MAGGGAIGSYQAGAIVHLMGREKRQYDIITGTSVGAINAAFLAQFPMSASEEAATRLYEMWRDIEAGSIYRLWYRGVLWMLPAFWKGSLYTTAPLRELLTKNIDIAKVKSSGRALRILSVNTATNNIGIWDETSDDIIDGVMASSAFPGVLPAVHARGMYWIDGGTRENTPLNQAIQAGATTIDVILCDPRDVAGYKHSFFGGVSYALNTILRELERADLDAAEKNNLLVKAGLAPNKRMVTLNVLQPSRGGIAKHSFDFNKKTIHALIQLGLDDAAAWTKG